MRDEREREQASKDSLNSSPCRACSDERGEPTEEGAERATGDRSERAAPGPSAREGAEETEARSRAPDERPEALPPLSLDTRQAGGEEAPREAAQGASRAPPLPSLLSHPSEGREEEEGAAGCMTSEEVPARGEIFGAGGREEPEERDDLLRSA